MFDSHAVGGPENGAALLRFDGWASMRKYLQNTFPWVSDRLEHTVDQFHSSQCAPLDSERATGNVEKDFAFYFDAKNVRLDEKLMARVDRLIAFYVGQGRCPRGRLDSDVAEQVYVHLVRCQVPGNKRTQHYRRAIVLCLSCRKLTQRPAQHSCAGAEFVGLPQLIRGVGGARAKKLTLMDQVRSALADTRYSDTKQLYIVKAAQATASEFRAATSFHAIARLPRELVNRVIGRNRDGLGAQARTNQLAGFVEFFRLALFNIDEESLLPIMLRYESYARALKEQMAPIRRREQYIRSEQRRARRMAEPLDPEAVRVI